MYYELNHVLKFENEFVSEKLLKDFNKHMKEKIFIFGEAENHKLNRLKGYMIGRFRTKGSA